MGSKKVLYEFVPFNTIPVTGATTYTSVSTSIPNLDNVGCQVIWVGTMVGTLTVLVSNDNQNFDSLTFNPILAQPTGSNLKYAISLNQLPWLFVAFQYVNTSGTGTLYLSIAGKDLN